MRSFIVVLILALVGCNNSSSSGVDPTLVAQIQALQNQVNALSGQVKQLQLIGRPIGTVAQTDSVRTFRMLGEPTLAPSAVTVTGQFGTCPNMGVQNGFTENPNAGGSALSALSKSFKTCTGYNVEYIPSSGAIKPATRLFWDGPNCTGNMFVWEAGGGGYDTETLQEGVVFTNPSDDVTTLMVTAHQTPQLLLFQSVIVLPNTSCQADVETQLVYSVTINNTQVTGVPNSPVGKFFTGSP